MTPAQRESLAGRVLQAMIDAPREALEDLILHSNYYDMQNATPVTFRSDFVASRRSRRESSNEKWKHVWCRGNYGVRGPKGGVYFVGRCVLGLHKETQVKGTLKVSDSHFRTFLVGGTLDAWFRPDGTQTTRCIGVLFNCTQI